MFLTSRGQCVAPRVEGVVRLSMSDIEPASRTLAEAFQDDPLMVYLLPDAEQRRAFLPLSFAALVRNAIGRGEVYATSKDCEGVVALLPPGAREVALMGLIRSGALAAALRMRGGYFRRVWAFHWHTTALCGRHLTLPHWHLEMIGVRPQCQNRGFGSFLMRAMIERLDADGTPCWLNTENEANVAFYQRFGYQTLDVGRISDSGCTCWIMARSMPATERERPVRSATSVRQRGLHLSPIGAARTIGHVSGNLMPSAAAVLTRYQQSIRHFFIG
jgi:ribosomal protein S18 acetylase RimI-like enzyme